MYQIRTIENTEETEKGNRGDSKLLTQGQTTASQKFPSEVLHLHLGVLNGPPVDYDHLTNGKIEPQGSFIPLFQGTHQPKGLPLMGGEGNMCHSLTLIKLENLKRTQNYLVQFFPSTTIFLTYSHLLLLKHYSERKKQHIQFKNELNITSAHSLVPGRAPTPLSGLGHLTPDTIYQCALKSVMNSFCILDA